MDADKNIIPLGKCSDYDYWKKRVCAVIVNSIYSREAISVVRSGVRPETVHEDNWLAWNKRAKAVIVRNLTDKYLHFATDDPDISAYGIFVVLDNLFKRKSMGTVITLDRKWSDFKYEEGDTISDHIMKLEKLMADYKTASGKEIEMTHKIAKLFASLPSDYETLRIALMAQKDDQLTFENIESQLLEFEISIKEKNDKNTKALMVNNANNSNLNDNNMQYNRNRNYNNNRNKNNSKFNYKNKYFKNNKNNLRNHNNNYNRNFNNNNNRNYNNRNYNNSNRNFNNKNNQNFHNNNNQNFNNNNQNYNNNGNILKCEFCGRRNHSKENCIYFKRYAQNAVVQSNTASADQDTHFAFMMSANYQTKQIKSNANTIDFILDSGATDHMVNRLDIFSAVTNLDQPITISTAIKDRTIQATKIGTINVITNNGKKGVLKHVLYVPDCPNNLLSVTRIQQNNMTVIFKPNGDVSIMKDDEIIMIGKVQNNLIHISFKIDLPVYSYATISSDKYKLWHDRLGHIGKTKFLQMQKYNLVLEKDILKNITVDDNFCEACVYGKQARLSFNKEKDKSHVSRPLYVIHSDVCGPITPSTIDNKKYFITFIDEYTHYTVVYLLKQKSEVFNAFKDYTNKSEAMFNSKIAFLYCDNGTEYLSNEFKNFCSQKGIQYHLTVPYTPQQNSVSERMNRTLVEKARAMIHAVNLPKQFWGEAILTATHLLNILPTKAIPQDKTPFELWHKKKPNIKYIKIFGSTAYMLDKTHKNKFDKKSNKGILVGYLNNGYKIFNPEINNFVISRDVIFDEANLINSRPIINEENHENSYEIGFNLNNMHSNKRQFMPIKESNKKSKLDANNQVGANTDSNPTSEPNNIQVGASKDSNPISEVYDKSQIGATSNPITELNELGQVGATSKPFSERLYVQKGEKSNPTNEPMNNQVGENSHPSLKELIFGEGEKTNPTSDNNDRSYKSHKNSTPSTETNNYEGDILRRSARLQKKPIISYKEYDSYCYHMNAQNILYNIPNHYSDIENRDDKKEWKMAISDELKSLEKNKTWQIVPRPNNKNIIECRWVFAIKKDPINNKQKYKARLVAKGFSQQYMLDYSDTFAPVARISTFRLMLALANEYNLLIHQMDVKTAFLNGQLEEELYMKPPDGIQIEEGYVCKLNKALYGLKQAARCWFKRFDYVLTQYGFESSAVDRCLYVLNTKHNFKIYLLLYVDDILIFTNDESSMTEIKNYLKSNFDMVDMREIKTFLGIRVQRTQNRIEIDQTEYIEKILDKFNMTNCNSIKTPLPPKINYQNLNSDENYDAPCRELLGCLMYAMLCTRPDLCISLNILSRFQNKNNIELWSSLKRILRYLRGTTNLKLIYKKSNAEDILIGYVDSDWGSDEIQRKSTTGYIFKLFNKTICWNSKRQSTVATSSTEAEYMALYEAVKEACWLRSLLISIKEEVKKPVRIYEDNNGCIAIANNPTDHKRSKHIDIKYHFSRQKIEQKLIEIKYISTGEQVADTFTKLLPEVRFSYLRNEIGLGE